MVKDLGFLLSDLLSTAKHGSKIILTASSNDDFGNLNPLSKPDGAPFEVAAKEQQPPQAAWSMFRNTIKIEDEDKEKDKKLEIGKEICIKYAIFPRLLQLIASYLSLNKSVEDWEHVEKDLLESFKDVSKNNLSKSKHVSYEEFRTVIQQFGWYCSLFPEDYHFQKMDLIHFWTSQQLLQTGEQKPKELVGEHYFVELQNNQFFVEKKLEVRNDIAVPLSYKMHGLVKKFLAEVTKHEFCLVDNNDQMTGTCDANIRHVCFNVSANSSWDVRTWLHNSKMLQSLLFLPKRLHDSTRFSKSEEILKGHTSLRALNLAAVKCEDILSSLGELKELRYLKLGLSSKCLSDSVTQLLNLQTLDLRNSGITTLPKNFCTLKNLRHLYTGGKLSDLPPNFGDLNNLQTLDVFIVGENNGLAALSTMNNLVGKLTIRIEKYNQVNKKILSNLNLKDLSIVCSNKDSETKGYDDHYGSLEPPPGLESITICRWEVERFLYSLNSLVSVHIEDCKTFKYLIGLSTLPHLKFLELWDLPELESIDGESDGNTHSTSKDYFPALEHVMLAHLPKFVGWTSSSKLQQKQSPIPSQRLILRVSDCQNFKSMPAMRSLVKLVAHKINGTLLKNLLSTSVGPSPGTTLEKLEIDSIVEHDTTLYISKLIKLNSLTIRRCLELKQVVLESLSTLNQLEIHDCGKLEDISCAPNQLSSLETLEIKHCEKLALINNSEVSWKCFQNLRSVNLINILSLKSLKNGLCSLEKLEKLSIHSIYELRALPEWIGNLKQLHQLAIRNCHFLHSLPDSLGNLSKLQKLELHCCPTLKRFPESLRKLSSSQALKLHQCPHLEQLFPFSSVAQL